MFELELDLVARLGTAMIAGALIGVERQWRHRMAGLRTNALVATGAALFVILSTLIPGEGSPTRIAAQVVSGIGFLGAGVILRDGTNNIRGLNTAATLWCAAAVGALAGAGFLLVSSMGVIAVIGTNVLLRPIARKLDRPILATTDKDVDIGYQFRVVCHQDNELHVRALMLHAVNSAPVMLRGLHSHDVDGTPRVEVRADFVTRGRNDAILEQVVARLSLESGVTAVSWDVDNEIVENY